MLPPLRTVVGRAHSLRGLLRSGVQSASTRAMKASSSSSVPRRPRPPLLPCPPCPSLPLLFRSVGRPTSPSCTPGWRRRVVACARWGSSRARQASARPRWSTPLWRSWRVLPTCGWRGGSVSSPTAPAKPTCRSWMPWGSSVAGRTASDWWPGWHSTPRPGWCKHVRFVHPKLAMCG